MSNCKCGGNCCGKRQNEEKVLAIVWQRLIVEENTCPRCGSTEEELDKAVLLLEKSLTPLGIKVTIQKNELSLEEFKKNPIGSNQISFNGKLLEDLIEAKIGQSKCCDVCEDEECRTIEIKGESYEVVPSDLIVKAGLVAITK